MRPALARIITLMPARAGDRAPEVYAEDPVEIFVFESENQRVDRDPRVAHEHVDTAESLGHFRDRSLGTFAVGGVEANGFRLARRALDGGDRLARGGLVTDVREHDVGALLGQHLGRGATDSARSARDEGHLAGETEHAGSAFGPRPL
jgi:hypothetical protein